MTIHCPACDRPFDLTDEYLAEFGGMTMDCPCGQSIPVPIANAPEIAALEHAAHTADSAAPAPPAMLAYAAPDFPPPPVSHGVWRDGPFVVLMKGKRLPERCCVCNEPVERNVVVQTLKWIPPQHRSRGGGVSGLIGSAIADSYAQFIVVRIARCPAHKFVFRPKRFGWSMIAGAMLVLVALVPAISRPQDGFPLIVLGLGVAFAGAIVTMIPPRIRIDEFRSDCAWIKGFGEPYRNALPDLNTSYEAENAGPGDMEIEA